MIAAKRAALERAFEVLEVKAEEWVEEKVVTNPPAYKNPNHPLVTMDEFSDTHTCVRRWMHVAMLRPKGTLHGAKPLLPPLSRWVAVQADPHPTHALMFQPARTNTGLGHQVR